MSLRSRVLANKGKRCKENGVRPNENVLNDLGRQ